MQDDIPETIDSKKEAIMTIPTHYCEIAIPPKAPKAGYYTKQKEQFNYGHTT